MIGSHTRSDKSSITRDVAALVAQDTLGRILAQQLRHLVMRDVPLTPSEKISSILAGGHAGSNRHSADRSLDLEIHRRCFAAVLFDLILEVLPFIERGQSSALNRGDVDEYVFAACLRLDKSVSPWSD